jgi:thiosulfate/3-mercaptopyruvate sulfurtransferase
MGGIRERPADSTGVTPQLAPLVDPDTLLGALAATPAPTLLDVRWRLGGPSGRRAYDEGHLPGARFVDLDRDLAGPPGAGGRHPLPDPAAFTAAMRRCGVDADRDVVVYDEVDATAAARAWWLLRYFGHSRVRVLDGGYRVWVSAGYPVVTDEPAPGTGTFRAHPGHLPLLDADSAVVLAREGVLLDARAAARYRGEAEPIDPVAGHIPGAVSAPTSDNLAATGRLLPAAELGERFAALGAAPGTEVGVYCGSGVTAAHEVLALTVAGVPAALYVGSWSDWIGDPRLPVARGSRRRPD